MNRFLLLIFLISWSHVVPLSLQCVRGDAYPDSVLSIPLSLMANADVALLKTYQAEDMNTCMNDCCTEKYGSCTVVSFKKNASEDNCQHFNCRPVMKCKYSSSISTDSFSFSSSPMPQPIVPSRHSSKNDSSLSTTLISSKIPKQDESARGDQGHGVTKEAVSTYSAEQFAVKNGNTTIKPRKGVDEYEDSSLENVTRSGVKPRKGVSFDDVSISNSAKSNVKPRKGVGPYEVESTSSPAVNELPTHTISSVTKMEHSTASSPSVKPYDDIIANDLVSALEKVFEDDPEVVKQHKTSSSPVDLILKSIESTSTIVPSVVQTSIIIPAETSSTMETFSSYLQSSLVTSYVTSTLQTPDLHTAFVQSTETVNYTLTPPPSNPTIFEHSKLLFHEVTVKNSMTSGDSTESEKERKYKSSMHLVLSLVFGLLVLFAVLGVVAKRVYDGWMRRHYRRMDFLIDGLYNGY